MSPETTRPLYSRYSRQIILEQVGPPGQEKLLQSKVLILGCGALGSHLANFLARAGVGYLLLVDRDVVELNNLQRQVLFDEQDIGTPKAETAARKMAAVNSEIEIKSLVKDINNWNIENTIRDFDLVLDATDNVPTRMVLNDACVKLAIPWIYTGVIQTRGMLMNILGEGPCLRCLIPDLPPPGSIPTCESAGILNTLPGIVAGIESTEALKILLGQEHEKRLVTYDAWEHRFNLIEVGKNPGCECCARRDFKYLDQENKEIVSNLCGNAVQIIPPPGTVLDLKKIAVNLGEIPGEREVSDSHLIFQAEGKFVTLFRDGRAIIKGTGDTGVARALYSRYLGL